MKKVALVTYRGIPDLTDDDRLLVDCLFERGVVAEAVVWDSPEVDWQVFDSIVLRSCWDYHLRADEFSIWIDMLEENRAPLWNPPGTVRWNTDKRYLRDLARMGAAIALTVWLDRGDSAQLGTLLVEQGWKKAVVKPTVSASAHRTWLVSEGEAEAKQPHFEEMLIKSDVIVQQFVEEIVTYGEWSFMFFNGAYSGAYSHSVLKMPRVGDFRVQSEFGGSLGDRGAPASLVEQAQAVMDLLKTPWLYARVDGIAVEGRLLLMELELTEPFLFLGQHAVAPHRFADAIVSTLK